MNYLRAIRFGAGRFNLQGITSQNTPKVLALQINNIQYKQQKRDYKNFGHKRPEPPTPFSKFYCTLLSLLFIGAVVDWKW